MVRVDQRSVISERLILGFLARNYSVPGSTYREIVQHTQQGFLDETGKNGLSLRQIKRHLSNYQREGWVRNRLVAGTACYSVTRQGYTHYHHDLEGRMLNGFDMVPDQLVEPLMAKGVWRLTQDQARYFREYLGQEGSLLVLLPPGAGKTLVATIEAFRHCQGTTEENPKVLYLSPYKAINSQSTAEFRRVLEPLGIIVARQDGDHRTPREELLKANLIVSTFESAQFALSNGEEFMSHVGLVIVDELTILDATRDRQRGGLRLTRGANLDFLLTSLLHSGEAVGKKIRFVCLGIPNASEAALQRWLGGETTILDPSQRSERCEEKIAAFKSQGTNETWQIERKDGVRSEGPYNLAEPGEIRRMLAVVLHYLQKSYSSAGNRLVKPILVFVRARKDASELALHLSDLVASIPSLAVAMQRGRDNNSYRVDSSTITASSTVKELSRLVSLGIGFHHAGLFQAQRRLLEEMMNDGSLSVLFATTTLTHGVDFPVGTVLIDAQLLRMLGYSRLEYLQLRGRVDHKDPFHETGGMADAVVVMSQGAAAEDHEAVRELLQGVDPALDSMSLDPLNARTFMLRVLPFLMSRHDNVNPGLLSAFSKKTFYIQRRPHESRGGKSPALHQLDKQCDDAIVWCERRGLITRNGKGIQLGRLGHVARESGLGFLDASLISTRIRTLLRSSSTQVPAKMLALGVSLVESSDEVNEATVRVRLLDRVPRKLRKETESIQAALGLGLQHGVLVALVNKWIEEMPISEIVVETPDFQVYESGLLTSARSVARNLKTIALAIEKLQTTETSPTEVVAYPNLGETARLLSTRVRFGIREDIASSELGRLASMVNIDDLVNSRGDPEIMMRIVLRLLMKKNWSTVPRLAGYRGKTPITKVDLRGYIANKESLKHLSRHRDKLNQLALRVVNIARSQSLEAGDIGGESPPVTK